MGELAALRVDIATTDDLEVFVILLEFGDVHFVTGAANADNADFDRFDFFHYIPQKIIYRFFYLFKISCGFLFCKVIIGKNP